VTQTIGAVLMAPRFLTAASVCLGIGVLAGLISLRTYHPGSDRMAPPLEPTDRLPAAVRPAEEMADGATRLDDVMLVVLVLGLVACAVFVWLNLGRLMAYG
jgi:hypothetical protein